MKKSFKLESVRENGKRTFLEVAPLSGTYNSEEIVDVIKELDQNANLYVGFGVSGLPLETDNVLIDIDSGVNFGMNALKSALKDNFGNKYSLLMYDIIPVNEYENGYILCYDDGVNGSFGTYYDMIGVPEEKYHEILSKYM